MIKMGLITFCVISIWLIANYFWGASIWFDFGRNLLAGFGLGYIALQIHNPLEEYYKNRLKELEQENIQLHLHKEILLSRNPHHDARNTQ